MQNIDVQNPILLSLGTNRARRGTVQVQHLAWLSESNFTRFVRRAKPIDGSDAQWTVRRSGIMPRNYGLCVQKEETFDCAVPRQLPSVM